MTDLAGARLGQIALVCPDVPRATAFYRDSLGLRFLFAAGPQLAFFDAGGTRLMLSVAEGDVRGTSALYFSVQDIGAVAASLAAKGVLFINAPHVVARMPEYELWLAEFRDSEGNVLALMEEKR